MAGGPTSGNSSKISLRLENLALDQNTDDLERLTRDQSVLFGGLGDNIGGAKYVEVMEMTASDPGDNTTLLTLSAAALTNYDQVARAGEFIRLAGASPNPGTYKIMSVEELTIVIDAQFTHALTAAVGMTIQDVVDANAALGILKAIRAGIAGDVQFVGADVGAAEIFANPALNPVGVDFGTSDATIDFRRDIFPGQQVKIANSPNDGVYRVIGVTKQLITVAIDPSFTFGSTAAVTVQPVGQSALLNLLTRVTEAVGAGAIGVDAMMVGVIDDAGNVSNIFLGPDSGVLVETIPPSAVIDETANTSGTPSTATNPFTGAPKKSVSIQNDPTNTDVIFVGNSVSQSTRLVVGESVGGFEIDDLSRLWFKSPTATQKVNILGS